MDEEIESILCLIDELKSEDHNTRLHAINNLHLIAEAVGPERTEDELVPYIVELLEDDNEEVLLALANKLGELRNYLQKPQQLGCLLSPLQTLAGNEEDVVRDKAIESINKVQEDMDNETTVNKLLPVIRVLAASDIFSARIAACYLFHIPLEKLLNEYGSELIGLFIDLGRDDTPMVRRAAAVNLSLIYQVLVKARKPDDRLQQLYKDLAADEHDSVRMRTLESLVHVLSNEQWIEEILVKYIKDRSWRVRYALIEVLDKISESNNSLQFVNDIVELLNDPESEVRCATVSKLGEMVGNFGQDIIMTSIIPKLDALVQDSSIYVKISLVQTLCMLSEYIGSENTVIKILPMINKLLRDENYEIKISFLEKINVFNQTLGEEKVPIFSFPILLQLMKDTQWRVRIKVVEYLPLLAELMGIESFREKIGDNIMKWAEDQVYTIRVTFLQQVLKISQTCGKDWAKQQSVQIIQTLSDSDVFTKRMTSLMAIRELKSLLEPQFISSILRKLAKDPVPNIKLVVLKIIADLYSILPNKPEIVDILKSLTNNQDIDVQYYAIKAIEDLNL